MGRSTTSCFKIITCAGGDSADTDDLQVPSENKGSVDKRGWSFRKRSARHRVLSNTVATETPTQANKESPEPASLILQAPDTSSVPEKITVKQCTDEKPASEEDPKAPETIIVEKPQLPGLADSKASETNIVTKDLNENEVDQSLDESVVIVIQTAVRQFLARRELLKHKNVIKLQAAVRGHLVRQHAVGTLRCVQAIVKMQALVRARHTRLLLEKSSMDKYSNEMDKKKKNSASKPTVTYVSIEKLLSNSFARQLMESTPKTKPIHVKCDPLKPNSAWNWLERWMAVSSVEPTSKQELIAREVEVQENENCASSSLTSVLPEDELGDSMSNTKEDILPSEIEENLIIYDKENIKFHAPTFSTGGDKEQLEAESEKISSSDAKESSIDTNPAPSQSMQSDSNSQSVLNSLPHKQERDSEQPEHPKRSMKRNASEELETEGKKFVYGSRKPSNPAFMAVQSKFEDLSSAPDSSTSFQGIELNTETVLSGVDSIARTKEINVVENLGPHNSRVQHGGSECGTELSITSTLDSPDISDVGVAEYEHEAKAPEEGDNAEVKEDLNAEVNDASVVQVSDLSNSAMDHPEKIDDSKGESVASVVASESPLVKLNPERSQSDVRRELDSEAGIPLHRSSPEASPRSHMTVAESHGTPSSQVSVNAKKNRTEKSGSSQKRKSLSAGKQSPSNMVHDSGARSSMEHLPKDQKNVKRRNSFGSTRPENTDGEARDSSSNSSLPHFMQATESARAKVQANNSPRSSPDVNDRDYAKKRHSLPGANGRQGSPRVQQSTSQAQNAKGNGSQVIHEKKWQR